MVFNEIKYFTFSFYRQKPTAAIKLMKSTIPGNQEETHGDNNENKMEFSLQRLRCTSDPGK